MKLYCGRNRKGVWKASFDEEKLSRFEDIFESEVEAVHNNKVYMIHTYYGFDYNYGSKINPIFDIDRYVFQIFHSVHAAKKHEVWKKRAQLAKEKPDEYHVTPFSIASDDFGEPFIYGDAMSGKFNMEIIGVRVI